MADLGVWTVDGDAPRRVSRSGVGLERNLEDWIANDSTLLADGLTIVGRQVHLDGGPLDLLAIDWRDRWVVIELKRERLYRDALAQALDYASSIAGMDASDLDSTCSSRGSRTLAMPRSCPARYGDSWTGRMRGATWRSCSPGSAIDAGLERIVAHLGGYGVPITIVSFEVFEPEGGPRLLIRAVTEEDTRPPRRSGRRYTRRSRPPVGRRLRVWVKAVRPPCGDGGGSWPRMCSPCSRQCGSTCAPAQPHALPDLRGTPRRRHVHPRPPRRPSRSSSLRSRETCVDGGDRPLHGKLALQGR